MKKLWPATEERLLSQIKFITDIILAFVVGAILVLLYPVFGIPHFLYILYNFLLVIGLSIWRLRISLHLFWGGYLFAIILQFMLWFLFPYVNYIFTLCILFIHLCFIIYYRWNITWHIWGGLILGEVLLLYFPDVLFYSIRAYNLLVTGDLFFLKL